MLNISVRFNTNLVLSFLLLSIVIVNAQAIGSPKINLPFFISSPNMVGNQIVDGNDFDEVPITLEDNGNTSLKCGLWQCNAWTMSGTNGRGYYCSGFWNCTSWNGVTCAAYNCTAWTITTTSRRDVYCSGGWNCTKFNGDVCESWRCLGFTQNTVNNRDILCSGTWNCLAWNGTRCSLWNCSSWTAAATTSTDHVCNNWACLAITNGICSSWNCTSWTSGTTGDTLDRYCSGVINCTSWSGNVCTNWACTEYSAATTTQRDMYCNSFNCTVWNLLTKNCQTWFCTNWLMSGTNQRDYYCTGGYTCQRWIDAMDPIINSVNTSPSFVPISSNVTIIANVTDNVAVDKVIVNINGTNYTMIQNTSTTWYYIYNTSSLSLGLHNFTVYANDTSGNNATPRIGNFTVIDITPPVINQISDFPDPIIQGYGVRIDANVTDNVAVDKVIVNINGTNYTMIQNTSTTWYYIYNTSSLSLGSHNFTVYANDTTGNNATPKNGNFTIISSLAPSIYTDKSYYGTCNNIYFKVSVYDVNDQLIDAPLTNSLLDAVNTTVLSESVITGNGGTGIYLGIFEIPPGYTSGNWLIKTLSGSIKNQKTLQVS
ncbi:MAG: Ig-like domain-containing protein [Candidatus Micrarchaeia archaeon]